MTSSRHAAGFTLLEMLIVLAILSILGALAYPNYAGYIVRTKRAEGQFALIEAMQAQERYRMRHNGYTAFAADGMPDEDAGAFRWWSGAAAASSHYELDAYACPGMEIADCVEVRARPGTARVDARFRDPDCGALTLDSQGRQGAQAANGARCWP